jgi:succinate dehydrogenase/fumarate reductase-like Fe-S protein
VLDLSPKLEREEEGESEVSTETDEKTDEKADEKADEDTKPGKNHIFCGICVSFVGQPGVGEAYCGVVAPFEGKRLNGKRLENECEQCRSTLQSLSWGCPKCNHHSA